MLQGKLQQVAIIGVGGLGCPAALALAEHSRTLPPFELLLIDGDRVERSNLNRQILFTEQDIGSEKSATAASYLRARFPDLRVTHRTAFAQTENLGELLANADFCIDASDDPKLSFALNAYCVQQSISFCFAGIREFEGVALSWSSTDKECACLACVFGSPESDGLALEENACQRHGIIAPIAGLFGVIQAEQAAQFLRGQHHTSSSRLFRFHINQENVSESRAQRDPHCPYCKPSVRATSLDLRGERCPMTFLQTKLALEALDDGASLRVLLDDEKSTSDVAASCTEEGHTVSTQKCDSNSWELTICRGGVRPC